jgi:hypothetical protein
MKLNVPIFNSQIFYGIIIFNLFNILIFVVTIINPTAEIINHQLLLFDEEKTLLEISKINKSKIELSFRGFSLKLKIWTDNEVYFLSGVDYIFIFKNRNLIKLKNINFLFIYLSIQLGLILTIIALITWLIK